MKIIIKKFEPYPEEDSIGMAVGYYIASKTDRKFYIDAVVEYAEGLDSDEDYLNAAWSLLKDEIFAKVEILDKKPAIIGSVWSPSNGVIEEANEEPGETFSGEEGLI